MRGLILVLLTLTSLLTFGQVQKITGQVIDENLDSFPEVKILTHGTVLVGATDIKGSFKIEIPDTTVTLSFAAIGMETTKIKLQPNCNIVDIILFYDGTYDFMSSSKVDRLRKKRYDKRSQLYLQAHSKGLFTESSPCYSRGFVPIKPRLDEIGKENNEIRKQIKETYKKLQIGDTIRIPFGTSYRSDGTNRTTLNVWSSYSRTASFNCTIQGVIVDKDNRKGGYNLVYKVTSCKSCKFDSLVYEKKEVIVGQTFRHNMKYFKVLCK